MHQAKKFFLTETNTQEGPVYEKQNSAETVPHNN